ncbi:MULTISPECIES: O-methyltransferase [Kitasatospora]|uniref:O-methyltransferase n=1 Tax=Kitasatospora TaxID=2063 RepID=UPI0004C3F8E9|nr:MULTISPECIES: O-methyltransferase [unclassified Kitasatospora]WAL70539.1 O-methyltransferase [Kitasatospora sp. YST-16]WNW36579.1 O-methyltransferase [Streptomyces sp. Li-HN-5-13]
MQEKDPQVWTAVDEYAEDLLFAPDAVLDAALAAADEAGLPKIAVAANQGRLLHLLARMQGARRILEIGTLAGYSTIWLARALPADGTLTTLEIDPAHAAVATANLDRAGLADRVEVRLGPARDSLADLVDRGAQPYDFFFVDADKANIPHYVAAALELSRPGSVIVVDNVVRGGKLADADSTDPAVRGVRRMHELIAAEPRLEATTVQTVGSRGHDGFTLIRVGGDGVED